MTKVEFTPIAGGWVAYNGHYLKEILRLDGTTFFLYESPEGFGVARIIDGNLHFSIPLPDHSLIAAARDLAVIARHNPFFELMRVGMDLEQGGIFPELAIQIRTDSVSVRLSRLAWCVKGKKFVEYYADVETLGLVLRDTEFRLLFPRLASALGAWS